MNTHHILLAGEYSARRCKGVTRPPPAACSARTLDSALKLIEHLAQPRVGFLRLGHAPRVEVVQPHQRARALALPLGGVFEPRQVRLQRRLLGVRVDVRARRQLRAIAALGLRARRRMGTVSHWRDASARIDCGPRRAACADAPPPPPPLLRAATHNQRLDVGAEVAAQRKELPQAVHLKLVAGKHVRVEHSFDLRGCGGGGVRRARWPCSAAERGAANGARAARAACASRAP